MFGVDRRGAPVIYGRILTLTLTLTLTQTLTLTLTLTLTQTLTHVLDEVASAHLERTAFFNLSHIKIFAPVDVSS